MRLAIQGTRWARDAISRVIAMSLTAAVALAPLPLAAADLALKDWIEVSSPNFSITSRLSERKTRKLAHDLELFREIVLRVTNAQRSESPIPTRIVVLKNSSEWRQLWHEDTAVGFFVPGIRESFIALQSRDGKSDTATIQHEYVHHLLRNQNRFRYPAWYDEGLAEFLATARTRREKVELGAFPPWREGSFGNVHWIPLEKIIDPVGMADWPDDRASLFYSESWAFVHYLLVGSEARHKFGEQMRDYLLRLERATPPTIAFESAFEVDLRRLDGRLKTYIKAGRFDAWSMPIRAFEAKWETDVRGMRAPEVAVDLAQLALLTGDQERAKDFFEQALELEPNLAQAHAGLGTVHRLDKHFELALPSLRKAIELAPDDPTVQLDMASYWLDLAEEASTADRRAAHLETARNHLLAAWKLDKTTPETYLMNGESYLLGGKEPELAVEMLEEAESLLPSNLHIRLRLSEAYLVAGRHDDAAASAQSLVAWVHERSEHAERARELLARVAAHRKRASDKEQGAPELPDPPTGGGG